LAGASLLFWGWETSNLLLAAPLAIAIELLRKVDLRFDMEQISYNRLSDLCTVAFVALTGILVANKGVSHGILGAFQYMPVVLTPILLAQYASSTRRIHLSALFRYMRKLKQREPTTKDPLIDLSGAFFALALLAAGMANQRGPTYYLVVIGFAAWALCPRRPAHASMVAWGAMFAMAGALGYAGHIGLNRLQEALEDWVTEFQMRQNVDPSRTSTDLGTIGRLKQYDAILLRIYATQREHSQVKLLHRSSFNSFVGTTWQTKNAPLAPMQPGTDGTTWTLAAGDTPSAVRIAAKSDSGKTLLPLPAGTARVSGLAAIAVRGNEYGAVLAEAPETWIQYAAHHGSGIAHFGTPVNEDLVLPKQERAALERVAAELGLRGLPAAEAVKRVANHLATFTYSTFREKATPQGSTPLAEFLTTTKSGHCEYFATATALLLRTAGIPARYATGFAALEYSDLEGAWVVRARHAHAWTRAFVDGRWVDLDTTPPSWFAEEAKDAPLWQPVADLFRWLLYRWSQRGEGGQASDWWYALAAVLFAILAWRIVKGRRSAASVTRGTAAASRTWQGVDSEFYALERAIAAAHGLRAAGETVTAWLARVKPPDELRASALEAHSLHQRYRFDPDGLEASAREALRKRSEQALRTLAPAGR
jgi:hypothetical protein